MKKKFTVFDGLFIMLFYCRGTGTPFFGESVSLFVCLIPYLVQLGWSGLEIAGERYQFSERLRIFLWKRMAKKEFKNAAKHGRQDAAKRANPGQYRDGGI